MGKHQKLEINRLTSQPVFVEGKAAVEKKPPISDLELWNLFKKGDEAAFSLIYRTYFPVLYNYGLQIHPDKELIKDSIQDMFIELRLKRTKVLETNAIKPFLFTLLRRRILKYIRSQNNQLKVSTENNAHLFPIEISPEQCLINHHLDEEALAKLKVAIDKLTVNEREAIFHFYFESHSYQQMAEIMGFKHVKSARNLLYKALATLKSHIQKPPTLFFISIIIFITIMTII